MKPILFILACTGLVSTPAYGATIRASMLVSAITINSGSHINIKFIDDDSVIDPNDPTSRLPATAAGDDEYLNDAFRQELRERLKQFTLLNDVSYTISLKGNSQETLRLFIQNKKELNFEHLIDGFKMKGEKLPIIISLRH